MKRCINCEGTIVYSSKLKGWLCVQCGAEFEVKNKKVAPIEDLDLESTSEISTPEIKEYNGIRKCVCSICGIYKRHYSKNMCRKCYVKMMRSAVI